MRAWVFATLFTPPLKYPSRNQFFHEVLPYPRRGFSWKPRVHARLSLHWGPWGPASLESVGPCAWPKPRTQERLHDAGRLGTGLGNPPALQPQSPSVLPWDPGPLVPLLPASTARLASSVSVTSVGGTASVSVPSLPSDTEPLKDKQDCPRRPAPRGGIWCHFLRSGEDRAPSLTERGVCGGSGKGLEHRNRPDTCSCDAGTWPWGSEVKARRETLLG